MKVLSGYYRHDDENLINTQYDIVVNSCGRYELIHQKTYSTNRPNGRTDFQLLYIANGEASFKFNGIEKVVTEGHIVIYQPEELQFYHYSNSSKPIIYWIHFSGYNVQQILEENNFNDKPIYFIGVHVELISIFDRIITELNLAKRHYIEMCRLYIKQWLILSNRFSHSLDTFKNNNDILEEAIQYFNENSNKSIKIDEYAKQHNISCSWFIRNFKNHTGTTPTHYITSIRINKAKSLLISGSFNISQVASIVGYDNALYFSRIFKKYVGVSPRDYIKLTLE